MEKNDMYMLRMARKYREELNWNVIPLGESSKTPLIQWKKFQDQLASIEQIEEWWLTWPAANIGIVNGQISGDITIDTDKPEAEEFLDAHGGLREAPKCKSARGNQFCLAYPIGSNIPSSVNKKLGLEVRSDGLVTVVPPSVHPTGKKYA